MSYIHCFLRCVTALVCPRTWRTTGTGFGPTPWTLRSGMWTTPMWAITLWETVVLGSCLSRGWISQVGPNSRAPWCSSFSLIPWFCSNSSVPLSLTPDHHEYSGGNPLLGLLLLLGIPAGICCCCRKKIFKQKATTMATLQVQWPSFVLCQVALWICPVCIYTTEATFPVPRSKQTRSIRLWLVSRCWWLCCLLHVYVRPLRVQLIPTSPAVPLDLVLPTTPLDNQEL